MPNFYQVTIHDRQKNTCYHIDVPDNQYILQYVEHQGIHLPFSCRNGACTACAVRVLSGEIDQPEAMGLSPVIQRKGYALLCVSYARSDVKVETQDEDEVYDQQFGCFFGRGKFILGLPMDED